jgi:LAO/AO transport system kinase
MNFRASRWAMVRDRLEDAFKTAPAVAALVPELDTAVRQGQVPASAAADRLLAAFGLS